MAVTTNSTIEFTSKEALNDYLKTNSYAFASVNYLISHINNVWYVTIPRGTVVDSRPQRVMTNDTFDASQGISLNLNPKDIWYPSTANDSGSSKDYISVQGDSTQTNWDHNKIKNLSQLRLSYITSATFTHNNRHEKFTVNSDSEFKQAWRDNHTSYKITKIEAWGVK